MMQHPDVSVGASLTIAARLYRTRTAERLGEVGLFPGQEALLLMLADNGAMSIGQLAIKLSVRPATVSKTVTRLAAQGLLERLATDGDARLVMVQLSARGQELCRQIDGIGSDIDNEMLTAFDTKDKKRLRKLLRRAIATLAAHGGLSDGSLPLDDGDEDN
jgi:DNA-binding MarR family transcriptional regulator